MTERAGTARSSRRRSRLRKPARARCAGRKRRPDGGEAGSLSPDGVTVEATGETVGEAKWAALRELEQRHPGLDKSAVRFEVISEGERGLLGVGYEPARVIAHAPAAALAAVLDPSDDSEAAADVRMLAQKVMDAIGVEGRTDVREADDSITVTFTGDDVALLIGRHGQMIDSVQY